MILFIINRSETREARFVNDFREKRVAISSNSLMWLGRSRSAQGPFAVTSFKTAPTLIGMRQKKWLSLVSKSTAVCHLLSPHWTPSNLDWKSILRLMESFLIGPHQPVSILSKIVFGRSDSVPGRRGSPVSPRPNYPKSLPS